MDNDGRHNSSIAALTDSWDQEHLLLVAALAERLLIDTAYVHVEALLEARIERLLHGIRGSRVHEQAKYAQVMGQVEGIREALAVIPTLVNEAETIRAERESEEVAG